MRTFARLLADGVRLSILRRPRHLPLEAHAGHWLVLLLAGAAIDATWAWFGTEPPRLLWNYGVLAQLGAVVLFMAATGWVVVLSGRRALFWTALAVFQAAMLLPEFALGALQWIARTRSDLWLAQTVWMVGMAWIAAILLRLALALARPARLRALAAAALAFATLLLPWFWLPGGEIWNTDWEARIAEDEGEGEDWREPGLIDDPEQTMYAQGERLAAALDALAPQRPGNIDLYALAFGGDATEDVFRNEVEYAERLFATRFDAAGRTLALLNHPESAATRPLATATNLERALRGIGARMDPAEDILFLYLTSHGSAEHELLVQQPPLALDQLDPKRLRAALDASGIRWRVLVVSACYSGGYVDALRDPHTLVLTAASAKRTSFGCGAASDITWFGKAFLTLGLNRETDFIAAFEYARGKIVEWEKRDGVRASRPQIDTGEHVAAQLARWRAGFEAGPKVKFSVPEAAGDAQDAPQDAAGDEPAAAE